MSSQVPFVDAHCHLAEFKEEDVKVFTANTIIVAVSEDLESSLKTLRLSNERILPCIGIHPWNVKERCLDLVAELEKLVAKSNVTCMGEVGLDKKFTRDTWDAQVKVFRALLKIAKEYDLLLNLHAAGAWRDVLEQLLLTRIERAVFHWYTGPLDLLDKILENNYMITLNPSIVIQKKQENVVRKVDLGYVLSESDGPYKYRGLYLSPSVIPKLVSHIARIKEMNEEEVKKIIFNNFKKYFKNSFKPY